MYGNAASLHPPDSARAPKPHAAVLASLFFREAVRALGRHKTRSALTTLGVTIGIAAVVLVVAIGKAGSERAQAALASLGENLVWVEAGARNVNGVRTGNLGSNTLTVEDAEAIRREVGLITRVSPQVDGHVQAVFGNRNWMTHYRAESPEYLAIRRWGVALGHAFSQDDVDHSAAKVLLGETVRQQLFGDANPVGEVVRLQNQLFEVIGVLAAKGQSGDFRDQDDWVFLPYTTAQKRFRARTETWLDDILCSAASPQAVDPAIGQIEALMRQRHHIEPGQDDDFNIRRPDEVLKAQVAASDTLAHLLISVAAVSLLVGGIGIMNVMLASVAQRTREIGLRMAVGARESAIRIQFLGEAVVLSLVGGVFGVALSLAGSAGFERTLGWAIAIPPSALGVAVVSAVSVGVTFGFYPAWRASRLDPIEALRHE
ncbi:MAG TPA: ABC transporter permease [Thermoanaerobaculaceae bacterium]|nr:ABC transporter permease [Thermoanaerobaculaceae bacterium]